MHMYVDFKYTWYIDHLTDTLMFSNQMYPRKYIAVLLKNELYIYLQIILDFVLMDLRRTYHHVITLAQAVTNITSKMMGFL